VDAKFEDGAVAELPAAGEVGQPFKLTGVTVAPPPNAVDPLNTVIAICWLPETALLNWPILISCSSTRPVARALMLQRTNALAPAVDESAKPVNGIEYSVVL
jgi:hypothetical protein